MTGDDIKFDEWAIVEVMGHSQFAGKTTEQQIAGAGFVRIDVPEADGKPAFTKLLGTSSIFAITPCTEQTAREANRRFRARQYEHFEMPMLPKTSFRAHDDDGYRNPDDDEL